MQRLVQLLAKHRQGCQLGGSILGALDLLP
jgi:hypothetical protein